VVSLKPDAKVALLASIPLFAHCNKRDLRRIAALTSAVEVPAGDVLCREGTPGSEFFVIVDGAAVITVGGKPVAKIGSGDFCGELALLDGGPRIASVTTTEPTRVLVLHRGEFEGLLVVAPDIGHNLLTALAGRLRDADRPPEERTSPGVIGA